MSNKSPALKVKYLPLDSLVPYLRNARTHSDEQVAQLAASITAFGWTNPILVDEKGGVIAGHGRLRAAQSLGMGEVPTICLPGLTEAQRRALVLADNKLALNAGWDDDILATELDALRDDDFDVSLLGFSRQELNDLIGTPNTGPPPIDPQSGYKEQYGVIAVCEREVSGAGKYGDRVKAAYFHTSHPGLCSALRRDKRWRQVSAELFGTNKRKSAASIKRASAPGAGFSSGIGYGGHFRAVQGFKYAREAA